MKKAHFEKCGSDKNLCQISSSVICHKIYLKVWERWTSKKTLTQNVMEKGFLEMLLEMILWEEESYLLIFESLRKKYKTN